MTPACAVRLALILAALAAHAPGRPACSTDADCARRWPDRVQADPAGHPLPYVPTGAEEGATP